MHHELLFFIVIRISALTELKRGNGLSCSTVWDKNIYFLFQSYNYLKYSNFNHIKDLALSFSLSNLFIDNCKTELLM